MHTSWLPDGAPQHGRRSPDPLDGADNFRGDRSRTSRLRLGRRTAQAATGSLQTNVSMPSPGNRRRPLLGPSESRDARDVPLPRPRGRHHAGHVEASCGLLPPCGSRRAPAWLTARAAPWRPQERRRGDRKSGAGMIRSNETCACHRARQEKGEAATTEVLPSVSSALCPSSHISRDAGRWRRGCKRRNRGASAGAASTSQTAAKPPFKRHGASHGMNAVKKGRGVCGDCLAATALAWRVQIWRWAQMAA